jgi:hypothetical protein
VFGVSLLALTKSKFAPANVVSTVDLTYNPCDISENNLAAFPDAVNPILL